MLLEFFEFQLLVDPVIKQYGYFANTRFHDLVLTRQLCCTSALTEAHELNTPARTTLAHISLDLNFDMQCYLLHDAERNCPILIIFFGNNISIFMLCQILNFIHVTIDSTIVWDVMSVLHMFYEYLYHFYLCMSILCKFVISHDQYDY